MPARYTAPMETLTTAFRDIIKQVLALSKSPAVVTEENVYQEADKEMIPYLEKMVESQVFPGSGVDGMENLEDLFSKAKSGKSCLLLMEHYSNMDLSLLCYLVKRAGGKGEEIEKSIVAIAGMKLNEDNPIVSGFASAYTRIVIYPSRSIQGIKSEKSEAEIIRSNAINRAAMKALMDIKNSGHLILLFPSGTRFRPWDPSTKRGVREIDSYIKSFDYMCMVAINGQVLHVNQNDMMDDSLTPDLVRLGVGPVISCKEFRDNIRAEVAADASRDGNIADKKQAVADAIMADLEKMHIDGEERRKRFMS